MKTIRASSNQGFVLYAILIVVILSAMVAVSLLYATKSAEKASVAGEQGEQAWAVAMSGVYKAIWMAMSAKSSSEDLTNNPDEFKEQLVLDDGSDKWYFTVYHWNGNEENEDNIAYGLEDEAGKINLKYLPKSVLDAAKETVLLSALNEKSSSSDGFDLAGLDTDLFSMEEDSSLSGENAAPSETSENGNGENSLENAPEAKKELPALTGTNSAPQFEFLDAFVKEKGYNVQTLYGRDLDMNLKADSGSEDVGDAFQSGIASGSLGMGLRHSLTTISYDLNVNSSGEARINLNSTNSSLSQLGLSEQTQAFIEAMQRNGRTIQNLSMLLNANERLQNEEGAEQEYSVELTDEEMETLFDNCTTIDQKYLPGLINVNTASVEVLEVLPGLDETDAEAIVDAREGLMSDQMTTPAWLIQQGTLDTEKFQAIYPYITTRSWQYHFYVAGYSIPSGRYCVLEVIADTAEGQPRTLMMRDLTRLGMPFKVETEESDNAVEDAA